jgi:pimeloyl-ACP methyl ester carboxylesterase
VAHPGSSERVRAEFYDCATVHRASPPHTFIASSDGVTVAVHDLGGPDDPAAPVLLFSHATGLNGRVWEPMAAELRSQFRCLAIDFRGHGLAQSPEGASLAWSSMADDIVAVLDSTLIGSDRVVHGIGHSMGGAALLLASARRPSRIRSLWLYEPIVVKPTMQPPFGHSDPMADAASRRRASFPSFDAAFDNFASKPPLNQLHPEALWGYVDGGFILQDDGTVSLRCSPATEATVFRRAHDSGAWDVLPALDLPVAVVRGRQPEVGLGILSGFAVEALPHATLFERPHLGHFGPLEDPSTMAKDVVTWVESIS